jgi:hypothetical protein
MLKFVLSLFIYTQSKQAGLDPKPSQAPKKYSIVYIYSAALDYR